MKRHNSRILTMLKLVEYHFNNDAKDDLKEVFELGGVEFDEDFCNKLMKVFDNLTEIDEIISKHLETYTIDRLSFVDLSIIELACFEMCYLKEAKEVAIDEAIELTKEYSDIDGKQAKFNNRLLDNIVRGEILG